MLEEGPWPGGAREVASEVRIVSASQRTVGDPAGDLEVSVFLRGLGALMGILGFQYKVECPAHPCDDLTEPRLRVSLLKWYPGPQARLVGLVSLTFP
ncbi:hypothetical protein Celaphus_00006791 [Cervus elaphus hippelaphus]|uniref:Uncharacterized protein n=1 Tax=Cervus elaphus hippelaphus TaxID=46360 RepID=A0A212CYI9_CEREH|nr:hypothetical protein Celaphus_00006791 [Cervus elaphus hippelaphus]